MSIPNYAKAALMLAAQQKNLSHGIERTARHPVIVKDHIDGPYIRHLDGTLRWLTFGERIRMFFGRLDAWELELLHFGGLK